MDWSIERKLHIWLRAQSDAVEQLQMRTRSQWDAEIGSHNDASSGESSQACHEGLALRPRHKQVLRAERTIRTSSALNASFLASVLSCVVTKVSSSSVCSVSLKEMTAARALVRLDARATVEDCTIDHLHTQDKLG